MIRTKIVIVGAALTLLVPVWGNASPITTISGGLQAGSGSVALNNANPSNSITDAATGSSASGYADKANLSLGLYADSLAGARASGSIMLDVGFTVSGILTDPCPLRWAPQAANVGCFTVGIDFAIDGSFNASPNPVIGSSYYDVFAENAWNVRDSGLQPIPQGSTSATYHFDLVFSPTTFPDTIGTSYTGDGHLRMFLQLVPLNGVADFLHTASASFDLPTGVTLTTADRTYTQEVAPVPEPASLLLVGTGLIGSGLRRWRRRN